jgi:predicted Zn-dependent peptidase
VFSPSHRYGRPVGGTAAALQTLTLADIEDFTARHYQPQNMTLYVLAPLELDAAKVVLDKLPGAFTGADLKQQMARGSLEGSSTGALREPGVLHRRKAAVPAPELWLAWPLSAGTLDERARAELLTELVRVGAIPQFGSHTAVAGARCGLDSLLFSALLTCRIFLNEVSSVETVAERVLGDIRDVMQVRPFGSDWIWWLRRRLALSWGLDEERVERRGVGFALAAHLYGDALDLRKVAAELQELDFRAITRDGYGLAQPEKTYMLLVEPLPSAATGPSVRMGFATPLADSASSAEPDIEPELAVQRLPRRAFDEVTTFRLASGLTVVLKPEAGTPYLTALLGFRGGAAWAGTAAVARAAQAGEVWKLTPDPVTWAIDLKRTRGRDSQAEIARTTSGDLNKVLEVLESASYPVIEWPSHRFRRAMPAQRRWDDAPEQVAERRLLSGLFGDHPYAAYAAVHDVEQVSFQATRRYTDAIRQPENAALIVVGDVDPSALRAASERHLAGFRGFGTGRVVAPPRPALEQTAARARSVSVVHRPRSTQADLEYGCLIPLATAADLAVLELAREVLDDELELRLRHRTGTAYFAGARTIPTLSDVSELRLATSVSSAHLPEALRALEEIFADGEAALEHLDDVRSRLIRSFAFRATTTHEKALELYDAWLRGLPWRSLDDRPRQIALAPVDQLRAALRICRANSALSVVGDEPAIRVALQAAGQ